MIRTVWTFPGQLSEFVGMVRDEGPSASTTLARNLRLASDLVGVDLDRLCRQGPESELRRHDCAAAAIIAVGAAAAGDLQSRGERPDALLGYSLGFYTAAAVAGAITLESALKIALEIAGEGERHFPPGGMSMAFVTGLRVPAVERALGGIPPDGPIVISNINTPAQIVLAGTCSGIGEALDRLRGEALNCGLLPIDRPYHSHWMAPVSKHIAGMVRGVAVKAPAIPLRDHGNGRSLETEASVRERLSSQLTSRLDWHASITRLVAEGARSFLEMPPGSTTTRMIRWIDRDVAAVPVEGWSGREGSFEGAPSGRAEGP